MDSFDIAVRYGNVTRTDLRRPRTRSLTVEQQDFLRRFTPRGTGGTVTYAHDKFPRAGAYGIIEIHNWSYDWFVFYKDYVFNEQIRICQDGTRAFAPKFYNFLRRHLDQHPNEPVWIRISRTRIIK